jgi:RHS repeat-associated protein
VSDGYAYDPYGNLLGQTGASDQPFTYIGQYGVRREPVGNLYDMRARAYDPVTARFLTRDPLWPVLDDPQSINPYQYAYENPLRYIDPWGTDVTTMEWVSDYLFRGDPKPDPIPTEWNTGGTSDILDLTPATVALFRAWKNMFASEDPAIKEMGQSIMERVLLSSGVEGKRTSVFLIGMAAVDPYDKGSIANYRMVFQEMFEDRQPLVINRTPYVGPGGEPWKPLPNYEAWERYMRTSGVTCSPPKWDYEYTSR